MKSDIITFAKHYKICKISDAAVDEHRSPIDFVLDFFTETMDYTLNWLFLSTSGVHGTYTNLDEIEASWDEKLTGDPDEDDDIVGHDVTVLILCPRLVVCYYGDIKIENKSQIGALRNIVSKSLDGIQYSQRYNMNKNEAAV